MIYEGCQGKPRTPTLHEKVCPQCGQIIELFSIDTEVACDNCGFVAYNDTLSCVQWCKYAKQCVGEEMYTKMMEIAANQFSTGLQQAVHDTHKLIDVMEIVQHTALHEYHIKNTAILSHIDLQHITDLVIDLHDRCISQLHGIPLVVLGNIEHGNLGTQHGQRHSLLTTGATDVGYPETRVSFKVIGIAL